MRGGRISAVKGYELRIPTPLFLKPGILQELRADLAGGRAGAGLGVAAARRDTVAIMLAGRVVEEPAGAAEGKVRVERVALRVGQALVGARGDVWFACQSLIVCTAAPCSDRVINHTRRRQSCCILHP